MRLGLGKQVLSTHKIRPDFENLKCNKILSVIRIVSKMSSYNTEIHEEFSKANIFWIAHTKQEIGAII